MSENIQNGCLTYPFLLRCTWQLPLSLAFHSSGAVMYYMGRGHAQACQTSIPTRAALKAEHAVVEDILFIGRGHAQAC